MLPREPDSGLKSAAQRAVTRDGGRRVSGGSGGRIARGAPGGRCARPSAGGSRTATAAPNGLAIISELVGSSCGVFSSGRAATPASSLRSAEARASGSLVSSAPEASAWYSRERLMASWIRAAASGPRIIISSPANGLRPVVARRRRRTRSWRARDAGGDRPGDRRDQDVAVVDVRQLVPEHGPQLALVEQSAGCRRWRRRRRAGASARWRTRSGAAVGETYRRGIGWRAASRARGRCGTSPAARPR